MMREEEVLLIDMDEQHSMMMESPFKSILVMALIVSFLLLSPNRADERLLFA